MPRLRAAQRAQRLAGASGGAAARGGCLERLGVAWPILPLILALAGCGSPPVRWVTGATLLGGASDSEYTLVFHGDAAHPTAVAQAIPIPAAGLPALGAGACVNSVRWARSRTHEVAVVWWTARADSSVVLRLAHSRDDGAHWDSLPPATTLDRGTRGCDRPAPAVALDPLNGYTLLAYWFEPASGAGVYYQQMTEASGSGGAPRVDTGSMFQAPVGIVYGEGPAETSVAGHGDTVAVAYQDPNGLEPHIALALSVTAGRAFLDRFDVTGNGIAASLPVVAIDENRIALGWTALARVPGSVQPTAMDAVGRRLVRLGVMP